MAGKEERSSYLYWYSCEEGRAEEPDWGTLSLYSQRKGNCWKLRSWSPYYKDQAISFHSDNCFTHDTHNVCSFCLSWQLYWGIFFILTAYPSAYSTEAGPPALLTHLLGEIWCTAHSPEESSSPHLRPFLTHSSSPAEHSKGTARAPSHSHLWRKGSQRRPPQLPRTPCQRPQGCSSTTISSRGYCWLSSLMFFQIQLYLTLPKHPVPFYFKHLLAFLYKVAQIPIIYVFFQ